MCPEDSAVTRGATRALLPHEGIQDWYLKIRDGFDVPGKLRVEPEGVPSAVPIRPRRLEYWSIVGSKNDRLIRAVLQAEGAWIAEHEKTLWQQLREIIR
jgi:hypothetical protein